MSDTSSALRWHLEPYDPDVDDPPTPDDDDCIGEGDDDGA
jgi:hypothetical protein